MGEVSKNREEIWTGKFHRASRPNAISYSPSVDSKKDGLLLAVGPVLPSDGDDHARS